MNRYEFKNNIAYLYVANRENPAIIDLEDYEKVNNYHWNNKDNYTICSFYKGERHTLFLHRIIINAQKGQVVDHINGNKLDNRKCNLRIATIQQNSCNHKRISRNSSGFTGVHFDKKTRKWKAQINYKRKRTHLGYFNSIEDAVKARKDAEIKYFGKYRKID